MNSDDEFEFNQAKLDLEETKSKLLEYIKLTYDAQEEMDSTFLYLESIVSKICKRQQFNICFDGGNPIWHARILHLLSNWIRLENKVGVLMSQRISS